MPSGGKFKYSALLTLLFCFRVDPTICQELGCHHLCLLQPNNTARCDCEKNMTLSKNDNKTCIRESFLNSC